MRTFFGISILLFVIVACKKEPGKLKYKAKFNTDYVILKTGEEDTLFTIFGDYVGSITPYHFSCKMSMLMFQDYYSDQDPNCHMISYVDGHDNDPNYEIAAYADFSGNKEVEFDPILYSTDMRDGLFEQKEIDFRFLTFSPIYFKHEFELPIEYLNYINNPNFYLKDCDFQYDSVLNKIIVKTQKDFSYAAIHGNANAMPTGWTLVLGNTDSSYIHNYSGIDLPESLRFPFWNQSWMNVIRSHKYQNVKIIMPDRGESSTMYSTISFYNQNLIQIYAGNDNIPYTLDDIFVYAPHFWNRVAVKLEMK
ncbi:MAG: hypothetical protein ACK5B9_12260 [Flavobacteriia bacterium]|jgi:hypothetical protein